MGALLSTVFKIIDLCIVEWVKEQGGGGGEVKVHATVFCLLTVTWLAVVQVRRLLRVVWRGW